MTLYSCLTLNLEAFILLHLHFKGVTRIHKNFSLEPKKEVTADIHPVFYLPLWRCCMFAHLHWFLQMLDVTRCTMFIGSLLFILFFNVFWGNVDPLTSLHEHLRMFIVITQGCLKFTYFCTQYFRAYMEKHLAILCNMLGFGRDIQI